MSSILSSPCSNVNSPRNRKPASQSVAEVFRLSEIFEPLAGDVRPRCAKEEGPPFFSVRRPVPSSSSARTGACSRRMIRHLLSNASDTRPGTNSAGCRRAGDNVSALKSGTVPSRYHRRPSSRIYSPDTIRGPAARSGGRALLGLAIVKRLGESLGARVEVRPQSL